MAKAPERYDMNMKTSDLSPILEQMEDKHLDSHLIRTKNYSTIINSFDESTFLDDNTTERLLTICHKDLLRDLQYFSSAIMIISLILKKIENGKCKYPTAKLLQSALILVKITKKLLTKTILRKIGFETLIAYPDDTLIALVDSYSEQIIDLIDYDIHLPQLNCETEITYWISNLMIRLLQVLPHKKKLLFVNKGLNIWFSTFLPRVMAAYGTADHTQIKTSVAALELLTDTLKEIDYTDNPKWQTVLKDICDQKRYPLMLKSSLETGSDNWHTLWKVFITLLKDQITKVNKTGASPINALLPVVEQAFKMDPAYRCKAFECWNVLIDNFSTELNESLVDKRLKLLMIPLKLNNAKVEETVVAKLNTWWHLIRQFHGKTDKFTDTILIPFLHFCFGKPGVETKEGKRPINPGWLSKVLEMKFVEALVEVVGHVDCEGCCTLPSVGGRLISTKLLVEHWSLWVHALQRAMKTGVENYNEPVIKRVKCLWKGFVTIIAELPDNQIRADLVIELLKLVEVLLESNSSNNHVAEVVFEILLSYLLEENPKIRPLLKNKHVIILRIVQSQRLNSYFARTKDLEENITKLKPLAALIMDNSITDADHVLMTWSANLPLVCDTLLFLWAALVDAIIELECNLKSLPLSINNLAILPLKLESLPDEYNTESIWYRWYKFYNHVHSMIPSVKLDEDIAHMLCSECVSTFTLKLIASIALLKQNLVCYKNKEFQSIAQILLDTLSSHVDLMSLEAFFPVLTDTLVLLMNKVQTTSNIDLVKVVIMLLQVTLNRINISLKKSSYTKTPIYVKTLQDSSRKFFEKLSSNKLFASLKTLIANTRQIQEDITEHTITIKSHVKETVGISDKYETKPTVNAKSADSDNTNFTTPQPKSVKKTNKKEPNIVNTVVVNGEEFVVVKSHWKFNPKKLTENQKEKFNRKRENIPALYQDLSQSQDEFKLTTWKTDSQDASTSASKSESNSKTNDDVAVILQKMSSTEVVPNIIENIFPDTANNNKHKEINAEKVNKDNNNKVEKTPTAKGPKTPRLALKDRVFRNVRSLMEKSGLQGDGQLTNQVLEDANQTFAAVSKNDLKTPVSKAKSVVNSVNSAPSKLTTERPTRSIKKPKKFDNTEVFALKKKRRSSTTQSDLQPNSETPFDDSTEVSALKKKLHSSTTQSDLQPDSETPANRKETAKVNQITSPAETGGINKPENLMKDAKHTSESATDEYPKSLKSGVDNAEEALFQRIPVLLAHMENIENSQPTELDNKTDQIKSVNKRLEIEKCKLPSEEKSININNDNSSLVIEEICTPKSEKVKKRDENPSSIKKRMPRMVTEILTDMVVPQTLPEKRKTRNKLTTEIKNTVNKRRKSLIEKSNNVDVQTKNKTKPGSKSSSPRSAQKEAVTEQECEHSSQSVTIVDSQDLSFESQDIGMSEDVIESSQDSTLTTISVKSAAKKKVPIVCLDKENAFIEMKCTATQKSTNIPMNDTCNETGGEDIELPSSQDSTFTTISVKSATKKKVPIVCLDKENAFIEMKCTATQNLTNLPMNDTCNETGGEDIELPKNKTMPQENVEVDLTENMDTEPIDSSGEVIIINDEVATPIVISTEDTVVGQETQEMAEADTLTMDVDSQSMPPTDEAASIVSLETKPAADNDITNLPTQDDITPALFGPAEVVTDIIVESSNTGSPLKDEIQRKKDFLNNTIEISPIKTLSPVRDKKSPSPETSSDFVVIKLTTPVQSDGEPFNEKCDSPEVFTEDKVSPDKRDQSPPRKEVAPANNSPSSSLSLKKNRPQMRFNGRAGQMLGLCVPENLQILNTERSENDESRKSSSVSTPARRNLKRFYNDNENQANENASEDTENFLKFTRPLPAAESSPATPILKRKFGEIDECAISPASKRKRVSFHDPPVSTTVVVQKYIEPCGARSPSNSAIKRQERQLRALTNAKSPKRLDNVFNLETILTKAVESFTDENTINDNDTEMSLDETPAAEVVKTSELNDVDPICPELLDCKDPIENIAGDLSSPSTKALLIKELEGKVETVADLAKMTELEVNRLCIKAPKIKVARKVLSKYASEKAKSQEIGETPIMPVAEETSITPSPIVVAEIERAHIESQTDEVLTKDKEMQTVQVTKALVHTQTDAVPMTHCGAQTNESGSKSTKDIISTCLKERPDFVEELISTCLKERPDFVELLKDKLPESSVRQIAEKLPFDAYLSVMDPNIIQTHLCKRYDLKGLTLFYSELFQKKNLGD